MSEQERPPTVSDASVTLCESEEERTQQDVPTVRLRLRKPKPKKKVQWGEGTVDNEHMNKKKSKCCCIYNKPRVFGESSSDTDDECENCHGHVERRKKDEPPPEDSPQGAEDLGRLMGKQTMDYRASTVHVGITNTKAINSNSPLSPVLLKVHLSQSHPS